MSRESKMVELDEDDEQLAAELAEKYADRAKVDQENSNVSPSRVIERSGAQSARQSEPDEYDKASAKAWRRNLASFIAISIALIAILLRKDFSPPQILPLRAKHLTHLKQFQGSYRDETLWGTYRPGLYFGMRTKEAKGLQTGLMWFDPDRPQALNHIRHQAEERDGLQQFGWQRHDGRSFGRQELRDGHMNLTTSFAKRFCSNCRGGDWAVRVNIQETSESATDDSSKRASVIFYIANSNASLYHTLHPRHFSTTPFSSPSQDFDDIEIFDTKGSPVIASGFTQPFGSWSLSALSSGQPLPQVKYLGLQTPHVHNLTDAIRKEIAYGASSLKSHSGFERAGSPTSLPNVIDYNSNVALFQYTGPLPMSIDFIFTASLSKHSETPVYYKLLQKLWGIFRPAVDVPPAWPKHSVADETLKERLQALSGEQLTKLLTEREKEFEARFAAKFPSANGDANPQGTGEVAKAALSNMLGSVGFFYGTSDVMLKGKIVQTRPHSLLASVPSRSFFPRGFLWDEGFHQLLLRKWDPKLSQEILAHWLDLLNSQGWMAREQILGEEARSRVPAEYIVQSFNAANPPTLFLSLGDMARELAGKMQRGKFVTTPNQQEQDQADFLRAAFPRMKAWLEWYLSSQKGSIDGSWRWRGRQMEFLPDPFTRRDSIYTKELNPKTLTSGLDDYPRASHPSKEERHVDLYCWMAFASSIVSSIGSTLKLKAHKYGPTLLLSHQLMNITLLDSLHYDSQASQYRDWGNHTEDVELRNWYPGLPIVPKGQRLPDDILKHARSNGLVRFVDKAPEPMFVPHFGYVSLFPLAMRMLPQDSPELMKQLEQIRSGGIMTPFGLRSLSTTSSIHGLRNTEHDQPYWRGPIWMNINYLVLSALKHYSQGASEAASQSRSMYAELRSSLLKLTVEGYEKSGYLWENYDENSGSGRGCRPFTGWSALMVLIAADDMS